MRAFWLASLAVVGAIYLSGCAAPIGHHAVDLSPEQLGGQTHGVTDSAYPALPHAGADSDLPAQRAAGYAGGMIMTHPVYAFKPYNVGRWLIWSLFAHHFFLCIHVCLTTVDLKYVRNFFDSKQNNYAHAKHIFFVIRIHVNYAYVFCGGTFRQLIANATCIN